MAFFVGWARGVGRAGARPEAQVRGLARKAAKCATQARGAAAGSTGNWPGQAAGQRRTGQRCRLYSFSCLKGAGHERGQRRGQAISVACVVRSLRS